MVNITIQGVQYNIPTEDKDVQLSQYEKWFDVEITSKEDEITFVSKVSGIDIELLKTLPLPFYNDLVGLIGFALSNTKYEPKNNIVIDGITYSVNAESELTLGEWVDVEEVLKGTDNRLASVLAIVCRPIGEIYDSKNLADRIELFKGLTMDRLFPLFSFFLTLNERYQKIMNHYSLVQEMVNQSALLIEISQKNGVGITRLRRLQMTISKKWTKFLTWVSLKFSTSSVTK